MSTAYEKLRERSGGFQERDLSIPADLAMLSDAREWAAGAASDFGMAEQETFEIKLATSEAVTNAIVYGTQSHRDSISLEARREGDALVFEVRDPGGDEPRRAPHAPDEGGRGLELMEMVMDEVELIRRPGGSVLRFAKRRSQAA